MAKVEEKKSSTKDIVIVGGIAALTLGGIYLMTRKAGVKKPGSTIKAEITVKGKGYPGSFQVGFGLSQSWHMARKPIKQFIKQIFTIELTGEWQTFKFTVKDKLEDVFDEGMDLDAYIFVVPEGYTIDPTDPEAPEDGVGKWYDNVVTMA